MNNTDKNKNTSEKAEDFTVKILISLAVFMFAGIIAYNTFFVPEISNITVNSGNITPVQNRNESKNENKKSGKININTANEKELTEIDGIGASTAQKIIKYRETHGGFETKEEIMNVNGIGEKKFKKIKNDITV